MMIAFDIAGVRFNYRVAGVFIEYGYVLLNQIEGLDFWFLPGGRVEIRETSEESLHREIQEELGISVRIVRLLWIVETFFELESLNFHELGLYYEGALPAGTHYSNKDVIHEGVIETGHETIFQWFPLDALHGINLVPPFLRDGLADLPGQTQHLIERR